MLNPQILLSPIIILVKQKDLKIWLDWGILNICIFENGVDDLDLVVNPFQVNVTADHRVIYGADLAAFLQTFSKIIENPESLTL